MVSLIIYLNLTVTKDKVLIRCSLLTRSYDRLSSMVFGRQRDSQTPFILTQGFIITMQVSLLNQESSLLGLSLPPTNNLWHFCLIILEKYHFFKLKFVKLECSLLLILIKELQYSDLLYNSQMSFFMTVSMLISLLSHSYMLPQYNIFYIIFLSCTIIDIKQFLIKFNFEMLHSPLVRDTGKE